MPVNPHPRHRPHNPTDTDPWEFNDIRIDAVGALSPPPAVGESGTYQFALWRRYGNHAEPEARNPLRRHHHLLEYAEHAGQFDTFERKDGVVKFTEKTPGYFEHSLLAKLEPSAENPSVPGRYGLVESVEPAEPPTASACLVNVDLLYLAPLDRYRSRNHLRQDLEYSGI